MLKFLRPQYFMFCALLLSPPPVKGSFNLSEALSQLNRGINKTIKGMLANTVVRSTVASVMCG